MNVRELLKLMLTGFKKKCILDDDPILFFLTYVNYPPLRLVLVLKIL